MPKCFAKDTLADAENDFANTKKDPLKKQEAKENLRDFFALDTFQSQITDNEDKSLRIQDFTLCDTPTQSAQSFLLFCLSTLGEYHLKISQLSSLSATYTPLLEIFIRMFMQEFFSIYKKGLRRDYTAIEDNRVYLKGKILLNKQICHNFINKERFYTSSDEYITDIAPNRLIKSTLEFLKFQTCSPATLMLIHQGLEYLEEIPSSQNIDADFTSCVSSRHFDYYDNLLSWCKLFLQKQSFTTFSGENKGYALLFPMEKLFESYVAYMLKFSNPKHRIHTQNKEKYLLYANRDKKLFQIKPDLHITKDNQIIIADTKWKHFGIDKEGKPNASQSDLYQVFAYAHYHRAEEVWLIYPKPYNKSKEEKILNDIKEWHKQEYGYLKEPPNLSKKIKIKFLFAPLAFY